MLIALVGCGIAVIALVAIGTANPRLLWLEAIVFGWSAMCVNKLRPENDRDYVSEFAKEIAGGETLELHCRVDGGYGIDGVVVATSQRLIYAPPPRSGRPREVLWTVPYCEITSMTTKARGGEMPGVLLVLEAGGDEYTACPVWSHDAKALSEVIARNRPETPSREGSKTRDS
jgi:hypothetical protein